MPRCEQAVRQPRTGWLDNPEATLTVTLNHAAHLGIWGDRPLRLWVPRRSYDYSHLKQEKAPGVRPWVLEGCELERGPDNEPHVRCDHPVAWIAGTVISEGPGT